LARLGNPEAALPPVVHVAGTNAKGSVIAFLRAILEAAGYRVHVYVSPHLVRFSERIRLAGAPIAEDALVAVLEECETANAGAPITFFEITTAAAFVAFSRAAADVLLLETGLGGRLDATNLVARPALTALTPVALDHQHFLGDTLAAIAAEKAGVLKPGVACVCAAQEADAARVIAGRAAELAVPLLHEGEDWVVRDAGDAVLFTAGGRTRTLPRPNLVGAHQVRNAGQAVACIDHLAGFQVPDAAIAAGLTSADWPGRLQRLRDGPLVRLLPADWELWVDGGHNPGAARVLAVQARSWCDRPLHLVVGMMEGKDPAGFLDPLAPHAGLVRTVAVPGEKGSFGAQPLADAAASVGLDARPAAGVAEALTDIVAGAPAPARVLICGSLYLTGTVLRANA